MASLYRRAGSLKIWIRYKDSTTGRWCGKSTGYSWDNPGDVRQARLLARRAAEREAVIDPGEALAAWVPGWLEARYGDARTTTPKRYARMWRVISRFLEHEKIVTAAQVRREHIERYLAWRQVDVSRNTAIGDIKMLAMIIGEAVRRGQCPTNPLQRPGLRKEAAAEKRPWSDADIERAAGHLAKHGTHWMQAVFHMGLYQACRLRQCAVPLAGIRLERGVIHYPGALVKGGEGFTQPIDDRFRPILARLVEEAKQRGLETLCVVPWDASLRLRRTFDRAGLQGLSHHGLRVTWITRAADAGVPESQAMAFAHHSSREVHRVYKKLSAIETAHVPALLALPALGTGGPSRDAAGARRGSELETSSGQTQTRSRGAARRGPSSR